MTTTQITKFTQITKTTQIPVIAQIQEPKITIVEEKQYKTPSYTRRATTNYYNKNKDNTDFKQKKADYNKKYYEKTKEKKFPVLNIIDLVNNQK